jgi:hypothetical protein
VPSIPEEPLRGCGERIGSGGQEHDRWYPRRRCLTRASCW